jgi:hypothetical protein
VFKGAIMKKTLNIPGAARVAKEFKTYQEKGEFEKYTIIFEGYRDDAIAMLQEESEDVYCKIRIER